MIAVPPTPRQPVVRDLPDYGGILTNLLVDREQPATFALPNPSPSAAAILEAVQAPKSQGSAFASAPPTPRPEGMSRGQLLAGIFADMLSGAVGRPGMFAMTQQREREANAERAERRERTLMERDISLRRLNQRQFANVPGVGHIAVDPTTLSSTLIQPSRTDAQNYAESLGHRPGTQEYARAVTDYALRSNGPTAFEQRAELQDDAQEAALDRLLRGQSFQQGLAGMRDSTTRRGQDLSAQTARRGQDLTDARGRRGQDITDARGRRGQDLRGSRGRGSGNSARAMLNGRPIVVRNNRWVDEQTGQPVQ